MPSAADRAGTHRLSVDRLAVDPALRTALVAGLDEVPAAAAAQLAAHLARTFGPAAVAVVHYGSHVTRADARPESAHDFFVVVDDYARAYHAAAAAGAATYRPAVATALARVLPPNVIAVVAPAEPGTAAAPDGASAPPLRAKCAVLSLADFRRACSDDAPDHFVRGRLFQQVQLAWTRDPAAHRAVTEAIVVARAGSFVWGRSSLPTRFDAEGYCEALLAASFAAEIRPETGGRVAALVAAQRATLVPMYAALLAALARLGELVPEGDGYRDVRPPDAAARRRQAAYFGRSKRRATARWAKYVALYDDWLEYIVHKVARRTGETVTLTPRERRWPLIFLWPRAMRFLRTRPQRQR
jgi:hypothetical protein